MEKRNQLELFEVDRLGAIAACPFCCTATVSWQLTLRVKL